MWDLSKRNWFRLCAHVRSVSWMHLNTRYVCRWKAIDCDIKISVEFHPFQDYRLNIDNDLMTLKYAKSSRVFENHSSCHFFPFIFDNRHVNGLFFLSKRYQKMLRFRFAIYCAHFFWSSLIHSTDCPQETKSRIFWWHSIFFSIFFQEFLFDAWKEIRKMGIF